MGDRIDALLQGLRTAPPCDLQVMQELRALANGLPNDYLAFMERTNGAEGSIGETYLSLWPAEEIKSLNEQYAVEEFAPGLLLFGSDGGDVAFGFDMRSRPMRVVEVPFVGMSLEAVKERGRTFLDFLEELASPASRAHL